MVRKIFRILTNERGFTTTFFAVMMPVFIAILGLTVDGSIIIYHRLALDTAADAATLAAIDAYDREIWLTERKVVLNEYEAREIAEEVLDRNLPTATIIDFEVPSTQPNTFKLTAEYTVPTFFLKIFGIDSYTLTTYSSAHGY
ncbi:hypothetical protein BHF71_10065 [Vulcanibacillus modesticaldus]|uniref:Putative Flp pilus-assembly TadG-like N-terminal domain-containing protein n=1 Tax=Vulcanibacillus modesticaldus TaxID=337097 RepID=A0A1D2YTY0_9BACI|nr:TadE/TadG family type IV pilus assembly protein [Vulcanibacillus modesticaldus]OEF99139.1 hypothetical protein BHF71_10065 [Vulcanibacillus modesticaldus]